MNEKLTMERALMAGASEGEHFAIEETAATLDIDAKHYYIDNQRII